MSFSKRQWITQDVIDYLMGLPLMYQIFYRVQTSEDHITSFLSAKIYFSLSRPHKIYIQRVRE